MYSLRGINKSDNAEVNIALGESYWYINRELAPKAFDEAYANWIKDETVKCHPDVWGLILPNRPDSPPCDTISLMNDKDYYVVNENGGTYACLRPMRSK